MLVKRQNNLQMKFFKWFARYTSGTSRKMCSTDTKQQPGQQLSVSTSVHIVLESGNQTESKQSRILANICNLQDNYLLIPVFRGKDRFSCTGACQASFNYTKCITMSVDGSYEILVCNNMNRKKEKVMHIVIHSDHRTQLEVKRIV